jgi:hypothetical protein
MRSMGNYFSFSFLAGTASIICGYKRISKQAVWKRMNSNAEIFMERVLLHVLKNKVELKNARLKSKLNFFNRLLIQDSTSVRLNDKLFDVFKGTANQKRKSCNLKIQAVVDIMKYRFVHFEVTAYSKNDQKASQDLDFLQKGDLLVRDLGYFVITALRKIIERKAFFISRLRYGISIYSARTGKEINILRELKKNNFLDMEILLSEKHKLPVRLIALKVPDAVASERRRKLKNNRDSNMNPSKEHLECVGWSIYITNVQRNVLFCDDINKIYAVRWEIEIIFKSWKGAFQFNFQKEKFSKEQVKILLFSRLIVITFITKIYSEYIDRDKDKISIIMLFKFITENWFIVFSETQLYSNKSDILKLITEFTSYEKRNRINLKQKIKMI